MTIQLAKTYTADVTSVESREEEKTTTAIGADHWIEYLPERANRKQCPFDGPA